MIDACDFASAIAVEAHRHHTSFKPPRTPSSSPPSSHLLLLLLSPLASLWLAPPGSSSSAPRPFWGSRAWHGRGRPWTVEPTLRFHASFSTFPSCCPSPSSFVLGMAAGRSHLQRHYPTTTTTTTDDDGDDGRRRRRRRQPPRRRRTTVYKDGRDHCKTCSALPSGTIIQDSRAPRENTLVRPPGGPHHEEEDDE